MNETLRRELARLREHNRSPSPLTSSPVSQQRRALKRQRQDVEPRHENDTSARLPDVTHHVPERQDVRVDVRPTEEHLQDQIVALREEVKSLRAVLQRIFRTGVNGLQTPL